jgi:hypothetical protein
MATRRAKKLVRELVRGDGSLVDDLIAERTREVRDEST